MKAYCAFWNEGGHRFSEPIIYDYTISLKFPNIIINAKNLIEAKEKIELINNYAKDLDRFEFNRRMIMRWSSSKNGKALDYAKVKAHELFGSFRKRQNIYPKL